MRVTYKGIVTKYVPYQDADKIVSLLTEEGELVSFKAKGSGRINSPFAVATSLGATGEYEVENTGKYGTLQDCNVEFNPKNIAKSIESYASLNFILESLNYLEPNKELYSEFNVLIRHLDKNTDQLLISTFYLYQLIKAEGIELQLDNCVICGSKSSIVDVDYLAGGFTCKECAKEVKDEEYLKAIRLIAKAKVTNLGKIEINEDIMEKLFKDLLIYFRDNAGYQLRSLKFLEDSLVK